MTLNACSTLQSTPSERVRIVTIPESLMQDFCEWQSAGNTVGDLAEGYVANTLCGKKYEAQVKQQREYVRKMREEDV